MQRRQGTRDLFSMFLQRFGENVLTEPYNPHHCLCVGKHSAREKAKVDQTFLS